MDSDRMDGEVQPSRGRKSFQKAIALKLDFHSPLAYDDAMLSPERTPRQRIMELLAGSRLTTYQLAHMLGVSERQIEDHLIHAVKSIARDKTRRFILEPSRCQGCDFVFRDRRRLTRPSRCPKCRSESVTAPRYGIESVG